MSNIDPSLYSRQEMFEQGPFGLQLKSEFRCCDGDRSLHESGVPPGRLDGPPNPPERSHRKRGGTFLTGRQLSDVHDAIAGSRLPSITIYDKGQPLFTIVAPTNIEARAEAMELLLTVFPHMVPEGLPPQDVLRAASCAAGMSPRAQAELNSALARFAERSSKPSQLAEQLKNLEACEMADRMKMGGIKGGTNHA
jgi:hypothetical protein